MKMAIAVEPAKHPKNREHYRIWFLETDRAGNVVSIGVKSKDELVEDLFKDYRSAGHSKWRAFKSGSEHSEPIEIYDFMAQGMFENTHFGNLPTLSEFQETLDCLQFNLEVQPHAS